MAAIHSRSQSDGGGGAGVWRERPRPLPLAPRPPPPRAGRFPRAAAEASRSPAGWRVAQSAQGNPFANHQQPGMTYQPTTSGIHWSTDDQAAADSVRDAPPPHPADGEWQDVTMDLTEAAGPGQDDERRLILVGRPGNGKSATGNTILGWRAFKSVLSAKAITMTCQREQGTWQDRKVSVVDTPAIFDSEELTTEAAEREFRACVELSQPGPHAFLLVTQVGRFTAEDVTAANRVWHLFGAESARRTIVLFTCLEDLGGDPLEEYVQMSDNAALRELIRQCRNHVYGFNNKAVGAERERQVSELMKMVENVIGENGGTYYVIPLREGPKKSPDSADAKRLEMDKNIQGPERRIVLVGRSKSGKSATGNAILGRNVFGTPPVSDATRCRKEEVLWNGRRIVVVDTVGFLDTGHPEMANTDEVRKCVKLCSPGPHVILWVMRPDRFSRGEEDMARKIKEIFSEKGRNYMIALFTHKDKLEGRPLENSAFFQDQKEYTAEYGNRYMVFNNMAEGDEREAQMAELMKVIDTVVYENGDTLYYTEEMLKKDIEKYNKNRPYLRCPLV